MATLEEISSRLEQGYFLKEDMETLGLSGYVSVAQMRAEIAGLLVKEAPPPQIDNNAELRAEASAEAARKEAQAAADRAALIASIEAAEARRKEQAREQAEAQQIAEHFLDALKNDPNVQQTP